MKRLKSCGKILGKFFSRPFPDQWEVIVKFHCFDRITRIFFAHFRIGFPPTTLACNCSLGSFQPVKYFAHRPTWRTFSKTSEFRIIPITINRTKYRRYGWGYWVTEYFTDQRTDLARPHPRRPPTYAFHPSITSGNSILGWKERQPTYHNKIVGQAPNAIRAEFNVVKGS